MAHAGLEQLPVAAETVQQARAEAPPTHGMATQLAGAPVCRTHTHKGTRTHTHTRSHAHTQTNTHEHRHNVFQLILWIYTPTNYNFSLKDV